MHNLFASGAVLFCQSLVLIAQSALIAPLVALGQERPSSREEALFTDGTSKLKAGNFPAAVSAFKQFLLLDTHFGPAYLNLGLAYSSMLNYQEAIPCFKQALSLDPKLQGADLFLGIAYCKIGRTDLATRPLEEAVAQDPKDADAHLWLGRALLAGGQFRSAAPHLETALKKYPDNAGLAYELAQTYLQLSEQITDNLYKRDPESAWAHFLKAQAYRVQGNLDLASIEAKTVLKLAPKFEGAHEMLADIYAEQKKSQDAESELTSELTINPHNYGAVCKIADIYLHDGKEDQAIATLNAAESAPSFPCLEYSLGRAWMQKGDYSAAVKHLKIAISRDPDFAPAYMSLGRSFEKLGETKEASAAFGRGRTLLQQRLDQVRQKFGQDGEP